MSSRIDIENILTECELYLLVLKPVNTYSDSINEAKLQYYIKRE